MTLERNGAEAAGMSQEHAAGPAALDGEWEKGGNAAEGTPLALLTSILAACCPGRTIDATRPLIFLGLSSLAATRFLLQVELATGVKLTTGRIAEGLCLADIARMVADGAAAPSSPAAVPSAAPVSDAGAGDWEIPLLPLQQSYLVTSLDGFVEDAIGCHIYREYELSGFEPEQIAAAWDRLCLLQPMLRARISDTGAYAPGAGPRIETVRVAVSEYRSEIGTFRARWQARTNRTPDALIKVAAVACPGRVTVILSADGLVIDGQGLTTLLMQWSHLLRTPDVALSPPVLSYAEGVRRVSAAVTPDSRRYWENRLETMPPPLFGPMDGGVDVRVSGGKGAILPRRMLSHRLAPADWRACEALARMVGVSSTVLVFSAFCLALLTHRHRSSASVMVTTNARSRLPDSARDLIGSFTSCMLVPVVLSDDEDFNGFATRLGRELWTHLEHDDVGAVSTLRAIGQGAASGVHSSVVFTSLLGDEAEAAPGIFRDVHCASQTSSVLLEHLVEPSGDSVVLRWFVVDEKLPPFTADMCFAHMVDLLIGLGRPRRAGAPLNALQQAYWFQRRTARPEPRCNAVFSAELPRFDPPRFDLERVRRVWSDLISATPALRSQVSTDGSVMVLEPPEASRGPAVINIGGRDFDTARRRLDEELGARNVSSGLWPMPSCFVMCGDGGRCSIHVCFDLLFLDGKSIHGVVCEMLAQLADPLPASGARRFFTPAAGEPSAAAAPAETAATYWLAKMADLPPGPATGDGSVGGNAWQRMELRLQGGRRLRERARRAGLEPDMLIAAAFACAWAPEAEGRFTVPLVWWQGDDDGHRPGEASQMAWLIVEGSAREGGAEPAALPSVGVFRRAVAAVARCVADDLHHGGRAGLAFLSRRYRQPGGGPALSVVYSASVEWLDLPAKTAESLRWRTGTPGIAMDAVSLWVNDTFILAFDYRPERFGAGVVERVFTRMGAVIDRLLTDPDWLDPVRPEEGAAVVPEEPVHVAFERAAARFSDADALVWKDGSWSFARLNAQANRIAHHLRGLGVGDGTKVAIRIRRGPHMVASVLGILKAGGAYVPIEPYQPLERAARMMGISDAELVLTTADTAPLAGASGWTVVPVDQLPAGPRDGANPDVVNTVDSTAYIIFTSGSTGEPKGVEVTHRPLQNLLGWCRRMFGFGPADRGLCVTSLGFDLSVFDILGLLGYGASLYVADEAEQRDPWLLHQILVGRGITFWNSAPKTFEHLREFFPRPGGAGGGLRLAFLSGDAMSVHFPAAFQAAFPGARLINLGGATEATVWSNFHEVTVVDPAWTSIPYGRPIDNARYYVLNGARQPCAPDEEGDLYIAGGVLAKGYYNRPTLTDERFLPDPFHGGAQERMYATGDRALRREDGVIIFRGRIDSQVKIRGVRIELEEIEHVLRHHPCIADAAVAVETDASGDVKLVAHVHCSSPVPAEEVLSFVKARLPPTMTPYRVRMVGRLPVTANGKLDRKRLVMTGDVAGDAAAPGHGRGDTETALADEICARLRGFLGRDIDPEADLWQQGVTSFTMVQLSGALRASRGLAVQVEWLLEVPTARGIAAAIAARLEPQGTHPAPTPASEPSGGAERVNLLDRAAKEAFTARGSNRRHDLQGNPRQSLPAAPVPPQWLEWRGTRRRFLRRPVAAGELGHLLGFLARQNGGEDGRFLYPSAGATYAVQVYAWVRDDAVADVAGGFYWFDPRTAELVRIGPAGEWDNTCQFVYNRPVFDGSAAAIMLVGELAAIEPLYGRDTAARMLTLEAGYMGQVLMMAQAGTRIGLCAIGSFKDERVRRELRLSPSHMILHSFLLGSVDRQPLIASSGDALFGAPFSGPDPNPDSPIAVTPRLEDVEIRVVGHSFRYPGAQTPEELTALLCNGGCAVSKAPERAVPDRQDGFFGAFLQDAEAFDPSAFGIAPSEAALIDPQGRLLLELVFQCLEQAGHTAASLEHGGERTGVFVGQMWLDHRLSGRDSGSLAGRGIAGAGSELANRISQIFGLTGPSVAVDTACTSALSALHLACSALRSGDCHSVLVCAVNLLAHPSHLAVLKTLGFVAERPPRGLYDPSASGWMVGEGAGVILLRRADAFQSHADRVLAVIEATHVTHPGGRAGYGMPSTETVTEGLRAVLAKAGAGPSDIEYVECAAAGAAMADAAEWDAIRTVFPGGVKIGSLKANIGHLEAASGMSQLSKVLIQCERGELLPSRIAPERSPLTEPSPDGPVIVDRAIAMDPSRPVHRCIVSAMGSTSGVAQVLLARKPSAARVTAMVDGYPAVLILSAETRPQLDRLVQDYIAVLAGGNAADWASVCATVQLSRKAFPLRLAVHAEDPAQAAAALRTFGDGRAVPGLLFAHADPVRMGTPSQAADWRDAVRDWVLGFDVDWAGFWPDVPHRQALPCYPFQRQPFGLAAAQAPVPRGGDEEAWLERVCRAFAQAAGIDPGAVNPDRPLGDYGITSRLAVGMAAGLGRGKAMVSPMLAYEHRDLRSMARALAVAAGPGGDQPDTAPVDGRGRHAAVIGYSGVFPGCADVSELWRRVCAGEDLVTGVPAQRRRGDATPVPMHGGFLDDVESFDPFLFGITPHAAARMDPQERLLLQQVWRALEDAGYPPCRLRAELGRRVGVYVGSMHNDYPLLGVEASSPGRPVDLGGTPAGLANRISYHLDVTGPSVTVDTMCSSSLTAVKLAMDDLRAGRIRMAIVAASNLSLHPNKFVQQKRLKMTSPSARCRSFSAAADGFVPSEGVVVLVLRAFEEALGHDTIHAVIRGVAVNHGGKSNGYTVPSPDGQAAVISAALADAGVAPESITYVETHGTGTVIGDPIEAKGIIKALALEEGRQPLAIGSIKSNLGHLEAAAGLAGLIKVIKQMEHRTIAPTIHCDDPNPDVDWTRLTLVRSPVPWPPCETGGEPVWRAGISSFGAGGSNAHVIIDAPPAGTPEPGEGSADPCLLVLSAATDHSLKENAKALSEWLAAHRGDAGLADVCFTLQVGREPLAERWAAVVSGIDGAAAALSSFVRGGRAGIRGRAAPTAERVTAVEDLSGLAARWAAGAAVDWGLLGHKGRRLLRLPGYRFDSCRCWIDTIGDGGAVAAAPVTDTGPGRAAVLAERVWRPSGHGEASRPGGSVSGLVLAHGGGSGRRSLMAALADALPDADVRAVDESDPPPSDAMPGWLVLLPIAPDTIAKDTGFDAWQPGYRLALAHIRAAAGRPIGIVQVVVDGGTAVAGAKLSALLRGLAAEYPWVTFIRLDVDHLDRGRSGWDPRSIAQKVGEMLHRGQAGDASSTPVGDSRPVWQEVPAVPTDWRPKPDGLYVITGGTRGLGAKLAVELAVRGARRLALIGRRRSETTDHLVDRLRTMGVDVRILYEPVTDRDTVDGWLTALVAQTGRIAGVFHCAGIASRGHACLADRTMEDIAAAFAPKAEGLMSFCDLLRRDPPDFLMAFSSISAVLPQLGVGVGDYAAANLAMEYLAEGLRRRHGFPVHTIAWPVWRDSGADDAARTAAGRLGLPALEDGEAFAFLWQAITTPSSGRLAVVSRQVLADKLAPDRCVPAAPAVPVPGADPGGLRIVQQLRKIIAEQTGLAPDHIRNDARFSDLGIESVALAALVDRLEAEFGLPLSPVLLLEHPCIDALAPALATLTVHHGGRPTIPAKAVAQTEPEQGALTGGNARKVAVVGLGVRFPGAGSADEFAALLRQGRCAITEVPQGRWDIQRLYDPKGGPGKTLSKWGGFIDGIEDFDPAPFGLSDRAARHLDPAIRLVLEVSRTCLRDAGLEDRSLPAATGVFIGARMGDYRLRASGADAEAGLGFDQNFIAAYLSHILDIQGPNLVVDAACSSALVAVHLACQSLLSGESEYAFAGGADVLLDQSVYVQFSRAGALSPTGQCRSFDRMADGFVPGEGAGAVLLKRLDKALRDGDPIHAVIEGSAVTNDGATMGLTTPNPDAHRDAITAALRRAERTAGQIGMAEAHGTATRIGDPIEFQAFTQAFRADTAERGFCAIGSVKSNIGHLLSAAGIAGLAKAVLAVEGGFIPPTLFCSAPNPRFDLDASPFYIPHRVYPWPEGRPRIAGVSACGLGGTNAHVIVAQAPPHSPARQRQTAGTMNRRRLWLDPVNPPGAPGERVLSSLLTLDFSDRRDPGSPTVSPETRSTREHRELI